MKIKGWKYYNHAAIPTCAPHENPDLKPIEDGSIWKILGGGVDPILARWTTDWDCGYETNWWYTILDKLFDIMTLNSHERNRIKRGLKSFKCKRIDPIQYAEDMAYVTLKDWETYPKSYRPNRTKEELIQEYKKWSYITHAAFDANGVLCAFHGIRDRDSYYEMVHGKSIPEKQKGQLNAALIYTYITDLSEDIARGKYISNGQRNINHETNFNEDLCKYYGFRKAYCKLNVAYNPKIKTIIKILYPFRKELRKISNLRIFHNLNVVLQMEEIKNE